MKKVCTICQKEFVTLTRQARRCPGCRNLSGLRIPAAQEPPKVFLVARRLWQLGFSTWEGEKTTHLGKKTVIFAKRTPDSEPIVISFVISIAGATAVAYKDGGVLRFRANCSPVCRGCERCALTCELNGEDIEVVKARQREKISHQRAYLRSYKRKRGQVRHYIANLKPLTTSDKLPDEQPTELPKQQDDVLQEI